MSKETWSIPVALWRNPICIVMWLYRSAFGYVSILIRWFIEGIDYETMEMQTGGEYACQ